MSAGARSWWSRGFVATGAVALVGWQIVVLAGAPRRTAVALGLYGFVLQVVFGKAYALVPSYFDRSLALPRAPAVHLPLSVLGVAGLALAPLDAVPRIVGAAGAAAWAAGVAVFLAALLSTIRDNPLGAEAGTGEHNAHRRPVDRFANLFVPVVLAYLAAGAWWTAAQFGLVPVPLDAAPARATHLLAAGTAALLVFAVGFRLLPRFLVASVPRPFPRVVLPAGAAGPALLAVGFPAGLLFRIGAVLQAVAVAGFAAAYGYLFVTTDRDRVGFYGPLVGVLLGIVGVALGLSFAFGTRSAALIAAHYRLNLLGFLGLTIVGVSYQFYPPAVGEFPGAGDRVALGTIAAIGGGLSVETVGAVVSIPAAVLAGRTTALAGALGYAYLLLGVFVQRARR